MWDLIIIGGACAGLVAGIFAGRKKINTLILTEKVGGQALLTDNIENFPGFKKISGRELIQKITKQVEDLKVPIREGREVVKIQKEKEHFKVITQDGEQFEAKTLIIATGKHPRPLNIPGERKLRGKGVSYCSICDAPLFKNKNVAVIGGGNAGLEAGLDLTQYAKKIYILEWGPRIVGDQVLQEKLRKTKKVEFIVNAKSLEIKGEKWVQALIYEDRVSRVKKELSLEGIFINIGQIPSSDFVKDFLAINSQGEIIIDPKTNQTSVPGIFAAGDVTDVKWKQCIVAAGEGAKALLSAYTYLQKFKKV